MQPSQVEFGDVVGYGGWDLAHGLEHMRFVQALAAKSVNMPAPDLLTILGSGPTIARQLQTHQVVHGLLRGYTNVPSVMDYTEFQLDQQTDFYNFLEYHEEEHAAIRAALGLM